VECFVDNPGFILARWREVINAPIAMSRPRIKEVRQRLSGRFADRHVRSRRRLLADVARKAPAFAGQAFQHGQGRRFCVRVWSKGRGRCLDHRAPQYPQVCSVTNTRVCGTYQRRSWHARCEWVAVGQGHAQIVNVLLGTTRKVATTA